MDLYDIDRYELLGLLCYLQIKIDINIKIDDKPEDENVLLIKRYWSGYIGYNIPVLYVCC